jgi:hypothetical protein
MLHNLLLGQINKFEFLFSFGKKGLKKGKMALTFAYDVGKKCIICQKNRGRMYNISKKKCNIAMLN